MWMDIVIPLRVYLIVRYIDPFHLFVGNFDALLVWFRHLGRGHLQARLVGCRRKILHERLLRV